MINDSFGQDIGDVVLIQVSELVSAMPRSTDVFVRYGGEEFLIVCLETGMDGAAVLGEKIGGAIEGSPFPDAGRVTLSVGISLLEGEDAVGALIKRTDQTL